MWFKNQLTQHLAGKSADLVSRRRFMIAKRPSDRPSLPVFFALTMCVLLTVCVPSSSTDQPVAATSAATQRARAAFGNLPLTFEPNQGQADAQVKYMTHWHGYNLFLTSKEAVFTMPLGPKNSPLLDLLGQKQNGPSGMAMSGFAATASPSAESVVRMTMLGANPRPVIASEDQQPGVKNYFIGKDPKNWHTNIPTFARVRYRDVYPGVDVLYHGTSQLEFDVVVRAGANPDKIKLNFDGAQRMRTDDSGDLVLTTDAGELRLQHPVSYQEKNGTRQPVDSRFVVKNDHEVAFALGSYDPSRELVIDPSISFATYFGGGGTAGSGEETGLGIAVDGTGNAYVVGTTNSSTVLPGNPKTLPPAGQFDCYVVKFNSSGVIVFTTVFGGKLNDLPQAVAVDSDGIYVAGLTQSIDFPDTAGHAQPTFGGSGVNGDGDAFVAKLATDGSAITWATYLGGKDFDVAFALAVDSSHNVFVAGETFSTTTAVPPFPIVNPLPQGSTNNGSADGFVTEVRADGVVFDMSSYIGGANLDLATGVAWNSTTLNVYVSGGTQSPNLPFTAGAFQQKCGSDGNCNKTSKGAFLDDGFVAAFNPAATSTYTYLTYLGGGGVDDAFGITTDSTGNAYVTGKTASGGATHFPFTASAYQKTLKGAQNAFVSVLDPTGATLVYSTYLGGEGFDKGLGIALDTSNNAYVTGQTTSTTFPTMNPTQQKFGGGNSGQFDSDAFLSELSADGSSLLLSTYIGGAGDEDILGGFVAIDSATGNIYVVGDTNSTNFPIQVSSGGGIADSSLNGGEGSQPLCQVLNRQTQKELTVVCPDAFVDLYTANTDGLLVTLAGTGGGTVTSSPAGISCPGVGTCSASFPHPTTVTLTATPNANSVFTGWSGGGCSGTGTCQVTLSSNQFVTATFTAVRANVSVTVVGSGTVTSSPAGINCPTTCLATFPVGTKVTLTATAAKGFNFTGWSGGGCSGTGTCSMTLNSDQAVTATFQVPSFTLAATPLSPASVAAGGSATSTVTITPGGGFDPSTVSLSCAITPAASPAPACTFGAISGGKSTLTVKTTAASAALLAPSGFHTSGLFYAMFLPIGGMAFLGVGLSANSRKKKLLGLFLICLVLSGLVFMVACGGGSTTSTGTGGGGSGTPAGKYTITVTGTANGVTEGGNPPSLTLTVQ
jgi:Divergent InlB B-repeat domain/Beta-propeller repeat